jgi:membrane protease subunit HflC
LFTVREGQVGVLTTFGKPVRAVAEPGLYTKWPWPIQRAYLFDNRTQVVEGPFEETLTKDGKNVLVAVYAGWKVRDPILFLQSVVGSAEQAARNLDSLLRHHKNAVLGQHPFASLVNADPAAIQFEQIEQQMLAAVQPDAQERYGIAVEFLGVRKLGLPGSITEKVFERMRAERTQIAEGYRSDGERKATIIRAEADSAGSQILAKGEADAMRLRAAGDAKAAESYQTFAKDPEFALFLLQMEALETTTRSNTTIVISSDRVPFNLLKGEEALPKK